MVERVTGLGIRRCHYKFCPHIYKLCEHWIITSASGYSFTLQTGGDSCAI